MNQLDNMAPRRLLAGVILLAAAPFMVVVLCKPHLYRVITVSTFLLFHNVIEFFSVMVALSIFGLGWFAFDRNKDRHTLYLSVAFLAIGLMDFMHALGYSGMPPLITTNTPNKSTQFWIAVRLFSAVAFLSSAYIHPRQSPRLLSKGALIASALAVSVMVFVGVIYFPERLPATFVQGLGLTPFKMVSEYVIILLLVLATIAYWNRLNRTGDRLIVYYPAAFLLCIFSELAFSSYQSVFDSYNVLGHLYKALAFLLIYRGIFVASVIKPYDELRLSRNMLSQIMDSVPQAIFWKDRTSVYLGCNRVFAAQAGLDHPRQIVGKSDFDLPWDREATQGYRADDREVMDRATAKRHIIESLHQADGATIWIDTTKIPLTDITGKVTGVLGVYEDITRRKEAEKELADHRSHLEELVATRTTELASAKETAEAISEEQRAIFDAATVGIVLARNHAIIRCNHTMEQLFGYGPGELLGKSTLVLYGGEARFAEAGGKINDGLAEYGFYSEEREVARKDGSRFWARLMSQALDPLDLSKGYAGTIDDITTEREILEALRDAKERAVAADQTKSAFLATMSHELRTPLNSIIGFSGILLQGLGGPINEEQKKQLTMVKSSANHLLSLISDILDISKIEAGQLKVAREEFNLQESLLKVVRSVRPLAEKKGLELSLRLDDAVGSVVADERRVEQILLNLLSNAVKFTEQGSVSIRCRREAGYYMTAVTDTGIGIADKDIAGLFKPFQQIDTGLGRKYEGTGLGLSICKRLVELMGGKIMAESSAGVGSTFAFSLPVEGVAHAEHTDC